MIPFVSSGARNLKPRYEDCSLLLVWYLESSHGKRPENQKAAKRFVAYWTHRRRLFGEDKAFLPMTLDGALSEEDIELMRTIPEYYIFLPGLDDHGRVVFMTDKTRVDFRKHDRYAIVSASSLNDAQLNGFAGLIVNLFLARRRECSGTIFMWHCRTRRCRKKAWL